ncbi:uncharacterized protein [Epargyreus clarus]|uniref:uncharacterized protein n=1 Tax=Epargyreus clarus TaxID=520877 RepID=UPI003C2D2C59
MKSALLFLAVSTHIAYCLPPPHPAVVAVRLEEEQLPPQLRKPALRNPHLREILTLTSVLHQGEKPVFQREADSVPRREIYNILTHAGFIGRHSRHQAASHPTPAHSHHHNFIQTQQNFDSPFLTGPDLLQYL